VRGYDEAMRHAAFSALALASVIAAMWSAASAQQSPRGATAAPAHGDPKAWKFTLPRGGDPTRGRAAFERFECFSCHEVRGSTFPAPTKKDALGPELADAAGHHSPGFIAESIMNPSVWIDRGKGYAGPDGVSKMPSFADSMTVQELVDLVAFLRSLRSPGAPARQGPHEPGSPTRHGPH
jgi:mono/diheme cytochrome c family protein